MKKLILLFLTLTLCAGVQAQKQWTLRECVDYAILNNIEIKQQMLAVENSEVDLNTSRNSRLPNLYGSADPSVGQAASAATGNFDNRKSFSSNFTLSSSIPLYAGMQINNEIKAQKLNLRAAMEGLLRVRENLELQVTGYFLEALFKKEIRKVYGEQVNLTQAQVGRTEVLVQTGKAPQSQLLDINAQLAKDQLNLVTANNDVDLALLNLALVLNMEQPAGFDIAEPETEEVVMGNMGSLHSPDQIYETAIGIRPHVLEAEYRLQSSERNLQVAKGKFWPVLNLGIMYRTGFNYFFDVAYSSSYHPIGTQLSDNQLSVVSLNLSVPIFNRFQTRNQVRSAHLTVRNRQLELDNVKLALFKEIQQAFQSAVAARSKYVASEKSLTAAEESYKYAEERYQVGKSTVFELNDAQTKLLTSRSELLQARYDFLFRTKILDFYQGMRIDIE